jgi:hypothetical protein
MFFVFFTGLIIWFIRADRTKLDQFSRIPFDESMPLSNTPTEQKS